MVARSRRPSSRVDLSKLSAADRGVLAKLVEASKIIDALFLRQVWEGNDAMLLDLARDETRGRPRAAALLPDQQGSVVAARSQRAVRRRRAGQAGGREFLSGGASKAEIEKWIASLPAAERARATGFFTVIRRGAGRRGSRIVPYSVEYQNELAADCRAAARGRGADRRADARRRSSRSVPTRSCRTTTTTATSRGWS